MNKRITNYQNSFAQRYSSLKAFSFWKGRVALYTILKALGVCEGDEVILPGYTCVMDVNPIRYLGARPVYVDIEPDTFNMNVNLLEEKITPRTKVIIAQHTYGYVCNMDAILEIANRHNITVIEDCCLCLGSTYKSRLAGTFGKAAYFSFQWNKPFTTGLGGMAVTNDAELAQKINVLCDNELCQPSFKEKALLLTQLLVYRTLVYPKTTAIAQNLFRYLTKKGLVVGSSDSTEFKPKIAKDFFKAMSKIQANSGIKQLAKVDKNIEHRKKMAQLYDQLLHPKGWPVRKYDRDTQDPVLVRYPVRIAEKDKAIEKAAKAGIELGSWFECPLHPKETPLHAYGYEIGMCPEAEKASKETVNLPLHLRTTEKTVEKSVAFITSFKKPE